MTDAAIARRREEIADILRDEAVEYGVIGRFYQPRKEKAHSRLGSGNRPVWCQEVERHTALQAAPSLLAKGHSGTAPVRTVNVKA